MGIDMFSDDIADKGEDKAGQMFHLKIQKLKLTISFLKIVRDRS